MPNVSVELNADLLAKRERLIAIIRELKSCAVAYSGGVDSGVVAQAAFEALGNSALAVTAVSPSLADGELESARELAAKIGIRHEILSTDEFSREGYVQNAPNRCFFCKDELYTRLKEALPRWGALWILNGANLDDTGDHRPGMTAAHDHGVRSPLIECRLTKDEVRQLAQAWNLPVWDKPASPCLSSRIAYGEEVTPQRVAMIDRAEKFLKDKGFRELRVRYHRGDVARIELSPEYLAELIAAPWREEMIAFMKSMGFKYVALDLEGFRSGSLNEGLSEQRVTFVPLQIPER